MAWKCVAEGKELADERTARKNSERVEKYNISEKAVWFEGRYLPSAAITALRAQPSLFYPQCCCGRGIPVFKIRLDYGAEKPVILMLEHEKNAKKIISALCAGNPAIMTEPWVDTNAGE